MSNGGSTPSPNGLDVRGFPRSLHKVSFGCGYQGRVGNRGHAGCSHGLGNMHHRLVRGRHFALGHDLPRVERRAYRYGWSVCLNGGDNPAHVADIGRADQGFAQRIEGRQEVGERRIGLRLSYGR